MWKLIERVKLVEDYRLEVVFDDGERRLYDARELLALPMYAKLKNPGFFAKASAQCGGVVWDDATDLAPEYVYEHSVPATDGR